jgi:hypothetical protein
MIDQQRILSLAMDHASGEKKAELDKLKEELTATELCHDKATAAAFGYLLAKQEESEDQKVDATIDHQIAAVLFEEVDVPKATFRILSLVYLWLHKEFMKHGLVNSGYTQHMLREAFRPFVKPSLLKEVKPS